MKQVDALPLRGQILLSAAGLLENRPFETMQLSDVATSVGLPVCDLERTFGSMHEIGAAILTYEGNSMRAAQLRAQEDAGDPLGRLRLAFRYVGENLANDCVVRAGIRIAGESHHCFPERRIDPFRTWRRFITGALEEANAAGVLRPNCSWEESAWLLTAAGLGTKDLLAFSGDWESAPELLERVAQQVIQTLIYQRS